MALLHVVVVWGIWVDIYKVSNSMTLREGLLCITFWSEFGLLYGFDIGA